MDTHSGDTGIFKGVNGLPFETEQLANAKKISLRARGVMAEIIPVEGGYILRQIKSVEGDIPSLKVV